MGTSTRSGSKASGGKPLLLAAQQQAVSPQVGRLCFKNERISRIERWASIPSGRAPRQLFVVRQPVHGNAEMALRLDPVEDVHGSKCPCHPGASAGSPCRLSSGNPAVAGHRSATTSGSAAGQDGAAQRTARSMACARPTWDMGRRAARGRPNQNVLMLRRAPRPSDPCRGARQRRRRAGLPASAGDSAPTTATTRAQRGSPRGAQYGRSDRSRRRLHSEQHGQRRFRWPLSSAVCQRHPHTHYLSSRYSAHGIRALSGVSSRCALHSARAM